MRKNSIGLDEVAPEPPSRTLSRAVVPLTLAVVAVPFVYEGVLVCLGNWSAAMGRSSDVRTPVLDLTVYFLGRLRDDFAGLILPWFQHIPWQPTHVLVVAGLAMILSMLMLRR